MQFVYFLLGLTLLAFAGDYLVNGAVAVAQKLNIPTLVIGLTIVAIGTSMPELVVSIEAALLGEPAVALGNVIGSNISNATLILGVPALLLPYAMKDAMSRQSALILVIVTVIFMWFMSDGSLSSLDGFILLFGLLSYLIATYVLAKKFGAEVPEVEEVASQHIAMPRATFYIIGGIAGLIVGGKLTVEGALRIADIFNLSAGAVGLTIVALGTSLPELAASIAAARKNQAGLAIGNIIGSNAMNILGIMGITAAISPLAVSASILHWEMWIMLASTVLIAGILYIAKCVNRWMGALLVLGYIAFMIEVLAFGVSS